MCGDEDILSGRSPKNVLNARKKILEFVNDLKKLCVCENFCRAIFVKLLTNGFFLRPRVN